MSKQRWIFILGIWVALLPFLGFLRSWKNALFVITGLGLIYLSYLLRRERKGIAPQAEPEAEKPDTFTDNGHEYAKPTTIKENLEDGEEKRQKDTNPDLKEIIQKAQGQEEPKQNT